MDTLGSAVNVFREAEACLFMMTTVAKRLSPHDPEGRIHSLITALVLPGLAAIPPAPLQEVGCLLYAEFSHWISCHPDVRRQVVDQLIQIVERAVGLPVEQLQVRSLISLVGKSYILSTPKTFNCLCSQNIFKKYI